MIADIIIFVACICCSTIVTNILQKGLSRYEAVVGFEIASLLQFMLWIPIAIYDIIPARYLWLLQTSREIFDIFYLSFGTHIFDDKYRHFIYGHHSSSLISRSIYSIILRWLLDDVEIVGEGELCMLYYYICSIFLVLIKPIDKILLNSATAYQRFITWFILFILARITHIATYLNFVYWAYGIQDTMGYCLIVGFITLGLITQEAHSIFNSIPQLTYLYRKSKLS